jgi:hypothetical protein
MSEPTQNDDPVVSEDENPAAGDNQREERQYNRFDLTGYSDDTAVSVFNMIPNFSGFRILI